MLLFLTPFERLRMASGMYDSGRKLVIARILDGGHQLNASQLRGQLFLRIYGGDFTAATHCGSPIGFQTCNWKRTAETPVHCRTSPKKNEIVYILLVFK